MIRILSLRSRVEHVSPPIGSGHSGTYRTIGTDKDVYRRTHRRTGMVTLVTFAYNTLSEIWERSEAPEPIALLSAA